MAGTPHQGGAGCPGPPPQHRCGVHLPHPVVRRAAHPRREGGAHPQPLEGDAVEGGAVHLRPRREGGARPQPLEGDAVYLRPRREGGARPQLLEGEGGAAHPPR